MNTRQKGMILSNFIADQIVAKGLDPKARADGGSGAGTREKADICTSVTIFGQNLGIEAKNQKNINHKASWKQVKKLESLGCEPVLAFKDFGEPLGECKVIIYLDTFLELVKHQSATPISAPVASYTPLGRKQPSFTAQTALRAMKALIKEMENEN